MKKVFALTSGVIAAFVVPLISFAQKTTINDVKGVGTFIIDSINNIFVPVIFAIAFIVFVWGAFQTFIMGANDEETKTNGKNLMLWGLIGFFVMVSVWGLVSILTGTVGFGNPNQATLPSTGGVR